MPDRHARSNSRSRDARACFPSLAHVLVPAISLLLQFRSAEPVNSEGKDGSIEDDVGNVATGGVEGLLGNLSSAVPLFDVLVLGQPSGTHAHVAATNIIHA